MNNAYYLNVPLQMFLLEPIINLSFIQKSMVNYVLPPMMK